MRYKHLIRLVSSALDVLLAKLDGACTCSSTGEGFFVARFATPPRPENKRLRRRHGNKQNEGFHLKPSPAGEGGIRATALASMTDEVFSLYLQGLPSGTLYCDTSSTASGPPSPTGEGFFLLFPFTAGEGVN